MSMDMTKNVGYGVCTGHGVPLPGSENIYENGSRYGRVCVEDPLYINESESYIVNNVL